MRDRETVKWAEDQFDEGLAHLRKQRRFTKLAEYFNNPFSKNFDSSHDAHAYAVKLRNEVLPKIKSFIEDYKNRGNEESFTV